MTACIQDGCDRPYQPVHLQITDYRMSTPPKTGSTTMHVEHANVTVGLQAGNLSRKNVSWMALGDEADQETGSEQVFQEASDLLYCPTLAGICTLYCGLCGSWYN